MALFESPINGAVITTRLEIPLLKSRYICYTITLNKLIRDWLDGKIGTGAPTEDWEIELLRSVNELENSGDRRDEISTDDQQEMYDKLIELKALNHLNTATSHRKWLRKTHQVLSILGVGFSDEINHLIKIHDLSKYTHHEVIGYAIKFGVGQIDSEEEKREWEHALNHHLSVNPHHPEYFMPRGNGRGDTAIKPLDVLIGNAKDYLVESLIDMLACTGERQLSGDSEFSLTKWMDIDVKYMERYSVRDREFVIKLLQEWKRFAMSVNAVTLGTLSGHFGDRAVVIN